MKYWWIRIFDYKTDEELKDYTDIDVWNARRGTLLDEYYLCGEDMTREDVKKAVKERSGVEKFAKPRKSCGIYALIMDSNAFFYERFTVDVDTICFNCHKPIKGKAKDFPSITADNGVKYHFCSYDCRRTRYRVKSIHTPRGSSRKEKTTKAMEVCMDIFIISTTEAPICTTLDRRDICRSSDGRNIPKAE